MSAFIVVGTIVAITAIAGLVVSAGIFWVYNRIVRTWCR